MKTPGDYTVGQTFVLVVDDFVANGGTPEDYYNEGNNLLIRTGMATWVPITDADGNYTTSIDPFRNGPTNDPRTEDDTRGGRPAADEVNGTPYGRPEDGEVGVLNGNEVFYFTATSENSVYAVEMLEDNKANVKLFATGNEDFGATPTNLGHAPTTGVLNSPDNLAQDALGNIYIIEDAPNGSETGGDIWLARDADNDGVAESLDHFLSIRVDNSEATGMIFNPAKPTEFVVAVQHPESTNLGNPGESGGYGDAVWKFKLDNIENQAFVKRLKWTQLVSKLRTAYSSYSR
jgi:secreted PhoX family phosphatase